MMDTDNLNAVETWAGALLAKLSPAKRRSLNRKIVLELRRRQSQRIAEQRQPDGSSFIPKKARKDLRGKSGRIKRKKEAMFAKIRTARYMKYTTTESQLEVGFFGRIARIARIHQDGLRDKVGKSGPEYKYPVRVLLGFSESDRELIRDSMLDQLR